MREFTRIALPLAILAAGVVSFMVLSGLRPEPNIDAPLTLAPLVEASTVEEHRGVLDLEISGIVVPHREIEVSAEVAGRIVSKTPECRAGRYVIKGTPLIEIDRRDYQNEVLRLAGEREQAIILLKELDVELVDRKKLIDIVSDETRLFEIELARMQRAASNRAVSETEIDAAKRAVLAARNRLQQLRMQSHLLATRRARLKSGVHDVQIQIDDAEVDLDRTSILAPIDGMIVADLV
ncbi:unnamed protein product, partial [marine sediment metagenome]